MIYHVVTEVDWNGQSSASIYAPPTFEKEGFIHCCTNDQVAGVLERYYKGQSGLLLLHLDERKLEHPIMYEKAANDELFPHLYGRINKDAVISIEKIS
ncbi:MAG: DUF952 domain-containing protein [Cyclobacteriaceae bacterium]